MAELGFKSRQLGSHVQSMLLITMLYAKDRIEIKNGNRRNFLMWRVVKQKDHSKVCPNHIYLKQRNKCPHSFKLLSERRRIPNTVGMQKLGMSSVGTWRGHFGDHGSKRRETGSYRYKGCRVREKTGNKEQQSLKLL